MSRYYNMLYFRNQKKREQSFPPLERNPAWDEEDRQRWARNTTPKLEYGENHGAQPPGSPLCAGVAHNGVEVPSAATEESSQVDKISNDSGTVAGAPASSAGGVAVALDCADATTPQPEPPPSPEPPPEPPKPEPVSLSQIFDTLNDLLSDFLVCSDHQRTVLALWVLHTWCFDLFLITPYLNIYSPEKQSGKTLCLQVLRQLARNAWMPGGGLTATRLMQRIAQRRSTLLLDDWHTAFRPTETQAIIGFLNAGCAEDSQYTVRTADPQDKDIYSPKAFAGPGSLPAPLADRSIPIVLQRRKRSEKVVPFSARVFGFGAWSLVEQIRLWARQEDNRRALQCHMGELLYADLPRFSMRQHELAVPLLAIAAMLGGKWPGKARLALYCVFSIYAGDDLSTALQLLDDIRGFFAKHNYPKRIFTTALLQHLHELKDRPWSRYHKGKPLGPVGLRKFLRDFGVPCASSQRIGKTTGNGFRLHYFTDLWERYLPSASSNSSGPLQPGQEVHTPASKLHTPVQEVHTNAPEVHTNLPEVHTNTAEVHTNSEGDSVIPSVFNEWSDEGGTQKQNSCEQHECEP